MYAKLFSRIAQSSLMEQDVATRYCFMMLLAISDPYGDVIGTDVAIARTVNLPLDTFKRCLADLMSPDPDSNSQAKDGRRIVESEAGRGYTIVNYLTYRAIKSEEEKKAYMREYMARRRKAQKDNDVTDVKICKNVLTDVTQSESESDSELDTEKEVEKEKESEEHHPLPPSAMDMGKSKNLPSTPQAVRIAALFSRRPTTAWSEKESKALRAIGEIHEDDLALIEAYYAAERAKGDIGWHRRDIGTFLNNFSGELDRARAHNANAGKGRQRPGEYPETFDIEKLTIKIDHSADVPDTF